MGDIPQPRRLHEVEGFAIFRKSQVIATARRKPEVAKSNLIRYSE
jgi:hypothetical protein